MLIAEIAKSPTHLNRDSLVNNRPVAYEALFLGELPYEPQPDESDIGLSGLWRAYTIKGGSPGHELGQLIDQLPTTIATIISEHELHARSSLGSDGEAAFSLLNPSETMPIVADITSQALTLWEKALWRNGQASILMSGSADNTDTSQSSFDKQRDERLAHLAGAKSIVVETAAVVMKVLPLFVNNPNKPSSEEKRKLAKVLANWGPEFVAEWMGGKIIQGWLDGQPDLGEDEKQVWLTIFTPNMRKHFAVNNINDPLAGLEKVKTNLELLSDDAIAEQLGWTAEEAVDVISPNMRKHFAVHNINDPLAGLEKVKTNLELLSDDAIAERLGWTAEEAVDVISLSLRKHFAVNNINDPLAALEKVKDNLEMLNDNAIAEQLGWTAEEAANIFTSSMRKHFAVHNIRDPLAALEKAKTNLELLSDDAIAEQLGWTAEEAANIFTSSMRKYIAVHNIRDPLAAVVCYADGGISVGGHRYTTPKK